MNDLTSNYKLPPSSNTDLPSPSSSSNSSNPPSSIIIIIIINIIKHDDMVKVVIQHENVKCVYKKIGKIVFFSCFIHFLFFYFSREAARECRRKKKEYIKCLEERVAGLETQNKALIEELRQLKELYCQREDTNKKNNSKTTTTTTR